MRCLKLADLKHVWQDSLGFDWRISGSVFSPQAHVSILSQEGVQPDVEMSLINALDVLAHAALADRQNSQHVSKPPAFGPSSLDIKISELEAAASLASFVNQTSQFKRTEPTVSHQPAIYQQYKPRPPIQASVMAVPRTQPDIHFDHTTQHSPRPFSDDDESDCEVILPPLVDCVEGRCDQVLCKRLLFRKGKSVLSRLRQAHPSWEQDRDRHLKTLSKRQRRRQTVRPSFLSIACNFVLHFDSHDAVPREGSKTLPANCNWYAWCRFITQGA